MQILQLKLPQSLWTALAERAHTAGEPIEHIARTALADYVGLAHNTLFQISTSGALVNGIYRGAVNLGQLREHGGFGLGTFEGLDGEMVAFDGNFYQVRSDGTVRIAQDGELTPFAVVVDFHPGEFLEVAHAADLNALLKAIDGVRGSENLFYAIRIDGHWDTVHTRAMCKAAEGVPLAIAAAHQPEFTLHDVAGTMVGFWSPQYVKTLEIPGYHLHFMTADRTAGGHLLDCAGGPLQVQVEKLDELRMALPVNDEFLRADLTRDPGRDLEFAEHSQSGQRDK